MRAQKTGWGFSLKKKKPNKQQKAVCGPTRRFPTVTAEQTCVTWGRCIPLTSGCTGSSCKLPPGWSRRTWAGRWCRPSGCWWPTPRWSASTDGPTSGPGCTVGWDPDSGNSPGRPGRKTKTHGYKLKIENSSREIDLCMGSSGWTKGIGLIQICS